jgi:hypothetical protein
MKLFNFLFFRLLIFGVILIGAWSPKQANTCIPLSVQIDVKRTSGELANGSLMVAVEQGLKNVNIYLLKNGNKGGKLIMVKDGTITGLEKGNYALVITEKDPVGKFCNKHFDLTVM